MKMPLSDVLKKHRNSRVGIHVSEFSSKDDYNNAYQKAWIKAVEEKTGASYFAYRQSTIHGSFINLRKAAKNAGESFSLTEEEVTVFWKKPCYYCGAELDTIRLDRVNSSEGYILGNVVPCCIICNHGKMDMPIKEFTAYLWRVHDFLETKKREPE
jgi:hypothetical protein